MRRVHLTALFSFVVACSGGGAIDAGTDAGPALPPSVTSVSPDRGPIAGGTRVTLNGSSFADGATVVFGATAATSVVFETDRRLIATSPAVPAGRASVTVINPGGRQGTLPNAFLFEGTGTGMIAEALVILPASSTDNTGANPVRFPVRSQVHVPGVTDIVEVDGGHQGMGVRAQLGFALEGSMSFTWSDTTYRDDLDVYDIYQGDLMLPGAMSVQPTTYVIGVRFSVNDGASWVEGDRDGSANGLQDAQRPRVVVGRKAIDWCKLGGEQIVAPESFDLRIGQMGPTIYGQVYVAGVTNMAGAGIGLVGELGVGDPGTSPSTWLWSLAPYNRDGNGNSNDEFRAQLPTTAALAGDKRFAFRFSASGGPFAYCDSDGLLNNGFTEAQAGRVRISNVAIDECRLQFPLSLMSRQGVVAGTVYGQVLATTVTEAMGAGPGIEAQLGYGALSTLPTDLWTWTSATYNLEAMGGQEEWRADLVGPAAGVYSYAYRFRVNAGPWTYCDSNPSDGMIVEAQLGQLTAQGAGFKSISACRLQFVSSASVASGGPVLAYGRARVDGFSEDAGATPGLRGEVGVGTVGSNASMDPAWGWAPATFNVDVPDAGEDEFQATFTPAYSGSRAVSFRFAVEDGGWTYCDQNGSDVNGYEVAQQWGLMVGRPSIEYCNLQFPPAADAGTLIYGQVYIPGVTRDAGAPITAELGYGPEIEDPGVSSRWRWSPATYNPNCPACGNNNEYQAVLTAPPDAGHYAFRFGFGAAACYGDLDGAGSVVGGFNGSGGSNLGRVTR